MTRQKVYGGLIMRDGRQVRAVVLAGSQKDAAARFNVSLHEFRKFFAETGNDQEILAAQEYPGRVVHMPRTAP